MDAVEFAAGDRQVTAGFRAAGQGDGVVLLHQLLRVDAAGCADMGAVSTEPLAKA